MKLSFLSKEYIRFDERGHKNIKPRPFLKPALEISYEKIFKKKERDLRKSDEMKKHTPISDEEYKDILQWLNEEVGIRTESLSEKEIIKTRNTFSFQRWRMRKDYHEFEAAMGETRLGSILISIIERIDEMFEKIFC